jgi:uncharacterized tellurite resistance protein B-like protein
LNNLQILVFFSNKFYRFNTKGAIDMAGLIDSIFGFFGRKKDSQTSPSNSTLTIKPSIETSQEDEEINFQPSNWVAVSQNISDPNKPDDEFQSITVHGHSIYDPPITYATSATSGMTWVGRGQSITVQGFTICNPLTYWSNNNCPEASCITTSLKIEKTSNTNTPALPYWPQYSRLTPIQRGKYLSWLSQGRNDDLNEIGYAFIFFYGLERRVLLDKQDCDEILMEVRRLLLRYPLSGSFNSYLNQFVAYVVGLHLSRMQDSAIKNYFPSFDNLDESSAKVLLSWHRANNLSVQWELAYSLAKSSAGFTRTNIAKKSPALLKQLFRKKFLSHFPDGIPIESDFYHFPVNYRPASPSLIDYIGHSKGSNFIEPLALPIPRLDSPAYNLLKKIWDECIEDLKPAVSKLNKTEGKITGNVYSALPEILKKEISHPDLELWRNFISSKQSVDGLVIVQISDLAAMTGIEKRDALTSNQSKTITSIVKDFGWCVVPDQTISGTSYKWDDPVAVIPFSETKQNISKHFQSAALIFEMAYGIAAADEKVSDTEENFLYNFVSEQFSLNPLENDCLKGLQKVLESQPPSLSKIGKRLSKHLKPEQKTALADFLGEIVLLDNKFVKSEQKALKTVLKSLEMDQTLSDALIRKLLIGHIPDEPVPVQKPETSRKGEKIPPKVIKPEFSIDKEKLKRTMEDTRAVQNILASVFEQEQEELSIEIEPEVTIPVAQVKTNVVQQDMDLPFPPETIPSLDAKYLLMLHDIMKSNELSQDDFTGLARKHNLMPRATFDDINAWADEELGDFLLEESESRIVINYKR